MLSWVITVFSSSKGNVYYRPPVSDNKISFSPVHDDKTTGDIWWLQPQRLYITIYSMEAMYLQYIYILQWHIIWQD